MWNCYHVMVFVTITYKIIIGHYFKPHLNIVFLKLLLTMCGGGLEQAEISEF